MNIFNFKHVLIALLLFSTKISNTVSNLDLALELGKFENQTTRKLDLRFHDPKNKNLIKNYTINPAKSIHVKESLPLKSSFYKGKKALIPQYQISLWNTDNDEELARLKIIIVSGIDKDSFEVIVQLFTIHPLAKISEENLTYSIPPKISSLDIVISGILIDDQSIPLLNSEFSINIFTEYPVTPGAA